MTRKIPALATLVTVGLLFSWPEVCSAKPSKDVLPAATKFSWSVANQQEFQDRLATTELGKMLSDPALKPFLDDLPRQLSSEASDHPLGVLWIDLGVGSADLEDLSEGEVTWALVHADGDMPVRVLMADVAGHQQQVATLLQKIAASMSQQKAKKTEARVGSTTLTVFDIPATANLAKRRLIYFKKEDQLVFTEALAVAETLLANLASESADTLAGQAGYQQVVKECQQRAGSEAADAILFLVPVDLSEALRQLSPKQDERADDGLAIARKHNFDAISAVGGLVTVGQGPFDFHLRLAVHAPQPWKNGMRICKFPNRPLTPYPWVRGDCNGYTMMNIDFAEFAKYVGPLFDDIYGEGEEGLYDDLKNTLREDPDGPQIDVDKELFGRLSPQVTLLARDALPATPDSPQRLIALSATDEAGLAAVVKKVLESDPNTEVGQVAGRDVYLSYVEETDDFGTPLDRDPNAPPSFVTCVAHGHLMFATDLKILENALTAGESMVEDADYKAVISHGTSLGENVCIQSFGRLRDAMHVSYELLRQGKPPSGGKSFRGLLNNVAAGEPPEVEPPKIDGSKLPPFDQLPQDPGVGGLKGITTDSGWFLEGFILKQQ